jgi:hypothetical protein
MYRVMWWNAAGDACLSGILDEASAKAFLNSMSPEQEARLVHVTVQ